MKTTEKYKQTEVGLIPSDWEVKELKDVAEFGSGTTPRREQHDRYFQNGTIYWVKTLDLNNGEIRDTQEKITDLALKETSSLKIYPNETVLVAMYGGYNQIGRTGLLKINACVNQALTAIKPDKNLYPIYLINCLNYRVDYWKDVATSSRKDPNITSKNVKEFQIPLPPTLEEQKAIATALSDADELIGSLEKLIAKKRNIKQGAMQKLLQPKAGWVVKKFKDVFIKFPAKSYQINSSEYLETGKFPIIDQGKKTIVAYSDNESKVFICPKEGVIIFGDHTRILKYVNYDFIVGADGTQLLSCEKQYNTHFVFYLLLTKEIPNTGYNRHFKFLLDMEFCLPQTKEEQTHIASILSDMDAEILALETKLSKYRQIKIGMMQNLLTGKIRLNH